jgi:hypothetical protein
MKKQIKLLSTILLTILTLTNVYSQKAGNLSMSVSMTNPSCNRYSNGEISVSPFGGTAPYTYIWSTGDTTQIVSNLLAGNYSVSVTDANNQTTAAFVTLIDPAPIQIQAVSTNVTTYGGNNGTIDVIDIINAVGTYDYTWYSQTGNGFNPLTLDQTNLSANEYKLVITDENGCQGIQYFTITHPFPTLNPTNLPKPGKFGNNPSAIDVYPNPSQGSVRIKTDVISDVVILNMNGQIERTFKSTGHEIFTENLKPGIYFVNIDGISEKFIVE